jgi:hypothetical protein
MIVVGRRRLTIKHRTVRGEEEDCMKELSDGLLEKQKHERRFGVWK